MISEQSSPAGEQGGGGPSEGHLPRRMTSLLLILALVGAPAVILRVLCVGRACTEPTSVASTVPFCSLPDDLRNHIQAGFREGRSPEVLGVSRASSVVGGTGVARRSEAAWPSLGAAPSTRVPIVFAGPSVRVSGELPSDAGLDDIAPTLARVLSYDRPHPEVRSGRALPGVVPSGPPPRLILVVVWKGVGAPDLLEQTSEWPNLAQLRAAGGGTDDADVGSLPLDPAATLTTIGTGGLPHQHGITSRAVLNDEGHLVAAWSRDAPVSVIASLADDWDASRHQEPLVGLIATDPTDRGVIGGNWYVDSDTDRVAVVAPNKVLRTALTELRRGYGDDQVADIAVVVDEGPISRMDSNLAWLSAAAQKATKGAYALAVTATGSLAASGNPIPAADVVEDVERRIATDEEVVTAATAGGLFLDQETLAAQHVSDDEVIAALEEVQAGGGGRLMDQVFPGLAVSFARYC